LAALVAAWPTLPDHIRVAVRALLGTVTASAGTGLQHRTDVDS